MPTTRQHFGRSSAAASAFAVDADTLEAVQFLRQEIHNAARFPETAVVLGSGLGRPAEDALAAGGQSIAYEQIPSMPQPAVAGHAGRLVVGSGLWCNVLFLQGRVHYYEGMGIDRITFAVRTLAALGVRRFIVTNAAGGIHAAFRPGQLMLINGHFSFLNLHQRPPRPRQLATRPSSGMHRSAQRARLWQPELRSVAAKIPTSLTVHEGVYAMMSGPNYETPAEVRMLQHLGADAVGMSTVPEALAAAERSIDVLGVSCITNIASGLSDAELHHDEVTETASQIESEFTEWLRRLTMELTGS